MLFLILTLALGLRLINLNQSLWLDEAVQAITSQENFPALWAELQGDFHPPCYHLLMWVWVRFFKASEISLRLPSVLFGVGTVGVIWRIGRQFLLTGSTGASEKTILDRTGALENNAFGLLFPGLAAFFLAINPFHVYYSQETRMYSMAAFFTALSMFFFLKAIGSRGKIRKTKSTSFLSCSWGGYFLATLVLVYTDYYGWLILLAQNLIFVFFKRRHQQSDESVCRTGLTLRKWVGVQALIGFFYLPWLGMFLTQLKTGQMAMTSLPEWGQLVNLIFLKALPLTMLKFIIGRITIFNKKIYFLVAGSLLVFYGSLIGPGLWKEKKNRFMINCLRSTVLVWLFLPLLAAWLISLRVPNYQPFRLLLVLPAFCLLLAWKITQTKSSMIRIIELLMVVGVSLVSLRTYYSNPYFHREDWRGLVHFLDHDWQTNAILPSATSSWPIKYYTRRFCLWDRSLVWYHGISQGIRPVRNEDRFVLQTHLQGKEKIYFIRYLVPLFDPEEKINAWLEEEGFVKIKEISFNQIPLWVFEKQESS
ncbi:MAG: hypothetical protein JW991_03000 [Candidatus Pacebacteria bacterium]|nr:hypothetical protein [Candidatus Paceibacterota bacterium]